MIFQNMKKALIAITAVLLTLSVVTAAFAAGNSECQVIYGGGEVCNTQVKFSINKLVEKPGQAGTFVDNINANDPKYAPNQNVNFKIIVTNTGNKKIESATVTDTFPSFLTFVAGNGTYDQNSKKLTYTISNLDPGKSFESIITARTSEEKFLPQDQGTICFSNQVEARESFGATASDASQVCVEKTVIVAKPTPQVFTTIPPKSIPNTGPEMFSLIALVPAALGGIALRKKSKLN